MKVYLPNNWQEFISQTYIKKIYNKISEKEIINNLILTDVFFIILGIVIDRFFDFNTENFMTIYFLFLLIVLLIIILFKFVVFVINQVKRFFRWKNFTLISDTPEEMINKFNDNICYDIVTSKSYLDLMNCENIQVNEKIFYYIECSYYRNKVINQLCLMIQKIPDVFTENKDEILYQNKISIIRLENILNIINDISNSLTNEFENIDTLNKLSLIKEENEEYNSQLKLFINKYKKIFN